MNIYIQADSIISPLGFSTAENFQHLRLGVSGIELCNNQQLSPEPFWAARVNSERLAAEFRQHIGGSDYHSRLEKMLLLAAQQALAASSISGSEKDTIFILATTKGNIDELSPRGGNQSRLRLGELADHIRLFFGNENPALVVCNACVSGVVAMEVAVRLLRRGAYKNAVVLAGDILSEYVVSGFQCFKAMSGQPCRPYDKNRDGINLGEAAAAMVLSTNPASLPSIGISGAACSNDANHISGPSRTGDGLFLAIKNALLDAQLQASDIDYLCLHGTATIYNDEMESKAIKLAEMSHVDTHSLKAFFGHTLGAAGLLESVVAAESMRHSFLIQSLGFEELGTPEILQIIQQNTHKNIRHCLKTASGFGGTNAAVVLSSK